MRSGLKFTYEALNQIVLNGPCRAKPRPAIAKSSCVNKTENRTWHHHHHHHHHHHQSVMELGHLLTCSGLTYPEVSSKVCHNSFCQLGNKVSLPWVIYYEAKGSNPTTGLTLLWARNPFRGNFNHWQVSQKEARQNMTNIFFSYYSLFAL